MKGFSNVQFYFIYSKYILFANVAQNKKCFEEYNIRKKYVIKNATELGCVLQQTIIASKIWHDKRYVRRQMKQ